MFRKPNTVVCNRASLSPFCQRLPDLEVIVGRLEVTQQCCLQVNPTQHITLHLKPGVSLTLQQLHNNLAMLSIIS